MHHWLEDRINQKQIHLHWQPGTKTGPITL